MLPLFTIHGEATVVKAKDNTFALDTRRKAGIQCLKSKSAHA